MSAVANRIVGKLWSYCHVLRDDGLSYQDYLEQLTFLLFGASGGLAPGWACRANEPVAVRRLPVTPTCD